MKDISIMFRLKDQKNEDKTERKNLRALSKNIIYM